MVVSRGRLDMVLARHSRLSWRLIFSILGVLGRMALPPVYVDSCLLKWTDRCGKKGHIWELQLLYMFYAVDVLWMCRQFLIHALYITFYLPFTQWHIIKLRYLELQPYWLIEIALRWMWLNFWIWLSNSDISKHHQTCQLGTISLSQPPGLNELYIVNLHTCCSFSYFICSNCDSNIQCSRSCSNLLRRSWNVTTWESEKSYGSLFWLHLIMTQ